MRAKEETTDEKMNFEATKEAAATSLIDNGAEGVSAYSVETHQRGPSNLPAYAGQHVRKCRPTTPALGHPLRP